MLLNVNNNRLHTANKPIYPIIFVNIAPKPVNIEQITSQHKHMSA